MCEWGVGVWQLSQRSCGRGVGCCDVASCACCETLGTDVDGVTDCKSWAVHISCQLGAFVRHCMDLFNEAEFWVDWLAMASLWEWIVFETDQTVVALVHLSLERALRTGSFLLCFFKCTRRSQRHSFHEPQNDCSRPRASTAAILFLPELVFNMDKKQPFSCLLLPVFFQLVFLERSSSRTFARKTNQPQFVFLVESWSKTIRYPLILRSGS